MAADGTLVVTHRGPLCVIAECVREIWRGVEPSRWDHSQALLLQLTDEVQVAYAEQISL
jgi:hypothetical protein